MGLEDTNFLYLLGRMGSDLVLTIFLYQVFNWIQYICAKFHQSPYARYIGMKILQRNSILLGIQIFMLTGYLDILIIAMMNIFLRDKSIEMNSADTFVFSLSIASMAFLTIIPIYMFYKIYRHKDEL